MHIVTYHLCIIHDIFMGFSGRYIASIAMAGMRLWTTFVAGCCRVLGTHICIVQWEGMCKLFCHSHVDVWEQVMFPVWPQCGHFPVQVVAASRAAGCGADAAQAPSRLVVSPTWSEHKQSMCGCCVQLIHIAKLTEAN